MKLSEMLNQKIIAELKIKINESSFPDINFEIAMQFLLTDGIIPKSNLPPTSFLKLEDWLRSQYAIETSVTATELKNQTGKILDRVIRGETVKIVKHGREVAEIKAI